MQNTSNIEAFWTEENPLSSTSTSSTNALKSDITEETRDEVEVPEVSGDSTGEPAPAVAVVPLTTAELTQMAVGTAKDNAAENLAAENVKQVDAVRTSVTGHLKKSAPSTDEDIKGKAMLMWWTVKNVILNSRIQ